MTKTQNYQLNQWDAADPIRREDFNADNQKIDAALAGLTEAPYQIGMIDGLQETTVIELGFQPSFGILFGGEVLAFVIGSRSYYRNAASERGDFSVTLSDTGITLSGITNTAQTNSTIIYMFHK